MVTRQVKFISCLSGLAGLCAVTAVLQGTPAVAQVNGTFPAYVRLQSTTPGAQQPGNSNISGTAIAGLFQGSGATITNLNASQLTAGTVPDPRLSSNVARRDVANLFLATNQFDGFLGVGRSSQVTGNESFGVGNAVNGFDGMYVRTAATGKPFYGYSLGGGVSAYTFVDGQDSGKWKLNLSGSDKLTVFPNGFVGVGRNAQIASSESFGIGNNAAGFDGMYVRTSATGLPFYGYSLNGVQSGYHFIDGQDLGKWKMVVGNQVAVTVAPTGRVGIGTTNPSAYGLHSEPNTSSLGAIFGKSTRTGGIGVYGAAMGGNESYGLLGYDSIGDGYGVYCSGNLVALGNKSFQIDHPLDPENKYLTHYCTESPTPQNSYSGNVVTGADGKAWVTLPDYFGSINKNFKYQLTVVDDTESSSFTQAKIGREIKQGKFLVMTSAPHTKVSWRVEADRNDLWVQKHGAPAEKLKPQEFRGSYQRPELYGLPATRGEEHVRTQMAPVSKP